jgi:hypothetical protein
LPGKAWERGGFASPSSLDAGEDEAMFKAKLAMIVRQKPKDESPVPKMPRK